MKENEVASCWNSWRRKYPTVMDVETTNFCNSACVCCLYPKMVREGHKKQGIMSLKDFMWVADKIKRRGIKIGGMYCLGEPLLDPTLFEKYAYARRIGVLASFVGLNTNVSLLTEDKWDKILQNTDTITLSFFNVGKEFERLTGGLNWKLCYKNAVDFIKYRDETRKDYRIFIGVNSVRGSDIGKVKKAFKDYRVEWAVDAELRWDGKVLTGVVDRAIMYPNWVCDAHEGRLELKWNGDCEICSYDIVKGETLFANIFEHSWNEINSRFKERWKKGFSLCLRCDYYHLYSRVKRAGFKYVENFSWQKPYLDKGEKPIR